MCRILVIDDEEAVRSAVKRRLEREGYEVILAADGAQALEIVAREIPDLILLDIIMPGIDGLEVCRRLKADPATTGIPVIFLTAHAKSEKVLTGFEVGAVDYVTKPFYTPELLARVHVHVALLRAQHEIRVLGGILPTCAKCKKIRDEQGIWHPIETYITQHSEAQFSHGLCPDCIPIYFPNYCSEAAVAE